MRVCRLVLRPAVLAGLVAASAGCGASVPPTRSPARGSSPAVVPAAPRARALPEPTVDPAAGAAVTLPELFGYAERHSPRLRVLRERSKLADALVEGAQVSVPHNPELSLSVGGRTVTGTSRFELEAELEQRFEIAGERGTRIAAAESARDAQRAEVDVARWELHAEVHALFYKLLVRQEQRAWADELEAFTESMGAIIDKRVRAGEASPLETIVARAELAKAGQLVIAARQAQREASLRLAELVGWPPERPLDVAGALPPVAAPGAIRALVRGAESAHPARRWLESEVRAARAGLEMEDREAWPEPAIGVRYAREAEVPDAAHVWMGTVRIPLPVWERNQAGRARARAEVSVAQAERDAFSQAFEARVVGAVARVEAVAERVRLYGSDILPAFEDNLEKLRRAFELGEIDVLELSQIQQHILVTQEDALDALNEYYEALAALEALSGVDVLAPRAAP